MAQSGTLQHSRQTKAAIAFMSQSQPPEEFADLPQSHGEDIHRVFYHLAVIKAPAYRAVLRLFTAAKERFEIALRPAEIVTLAAGVEACPQELHDEEGVSACLESLREWGNLLATRDVVSARTIEEYLHPKFLYQLTQAGEQAERALASFEENLARPGELSAAALREIADTLDELLRLLEAVEPDEAKAARAMEELTARFDTLVARAQMFMGGLQRELDRPAGDESAFLALKEELLKYLERFVRELLSCTYRIRQSLERFSAAQVGRLLHACVQRELAEVLAVTEVMRGRALRRWQDRWSGLRGWFISRPDHPAQSERLRQRAMESIPALLERVRRMHDQRANRADRSSDFLALARWFAGVPDEAAMHQLWRAAFALNSSRHLRVNPTTLQAWAAVDDGARPAWEEAPPYIITIAQWSRGRSSQPGKAPAIVDRTAARAALRARADAEGRALREARRSLAARTPCALSDLPELDAPGFEVLLDAISEAFAHMGPEDRLGEATTADGGLNVKLELPAYCEERACIVTGEGLLRGPDLKITLRLTDTTLLEERNHAV